MHPPACLSRLLLFSATVLSVGCATVPLNTARSFYRTGQPERGVELLTDQKPASQNRVLFYMERGTMRQAAGDLDGSSEDFIRAAAAREELEQLSVSKGAGSMLINDSVNDYMGKPYEVALLHSLTAVNHLSQGRRDEAGVEGRILFDLLSDMKTNRYPQVDFAWYLTGVALEAVAERSNADLAYQQATTDWLLSPSTSGTEELVFVALVGSAPQSPYAARSTGVPPSGTLRVNGTSETPVIALSDTHRLSAETLDAEAAARTAKTLSRIAVKEAIAQGIGGNSKNDVTTDFIRLILIGLLEQPDTRIWQSLPHWLMVGRIPIAAPPETVEFRLNGRSYTPELAPVRYGSLWFSMVRVL